MFRNKKKPTAVSRDRHQESPRNYYSRDTNVTSMKEDYITQMSNEIERSDCKIA